MQKNILIITEASSKIGMGHLKRTLSLCEELDISLYKCMFLVKSKEINKNNFFSNNFLNSLDIIGLIKKTNHELRSVELVILDLADDIEGLGEIINSLFSNAKKIQLSDKKISNFDPDIYINSDELHKKNINSSIKLTGDKYIIFSNSTLTLRPDKFVEQRKIKRILFGFGASDPGYYTEKILNELSKWTFSKYHFSIIIGPLFSLKRLKNIEKIKNSSNIGVDILFNPPVPELISNNNLFIGVGGTMLYEAMVIGIPTISLKWSGLDKYTDLLAREQKTIKLENINLLKSYLEDNNHISNLNEVAKKAYNVIDGKGKERIISSILEGI